MLQELLAQVDTVLGEQHGHAVLPLGRQSRQQAQPVGHRVPEVRRDRRIAQRAEGVVEQLQGGHRVVQGRRGLPGAGPPIPPRPGQQAHRLVAGQAGAQGPVLGAVLVQFTQHHAEPLPCAYMGVEQDLDQQAQQPRRQAGAQPAAALAGCGDRCRAPQRHFDQRDDVAG